LGAFENRAKYGQRRSKGREGEKMIAGVNAVAGIAGQGQASGVTGLTPTGLMRAGEAGPSGAPFASLLTDAVGDVNQLESQARKAVEGLMTGSGVDVHQAMIATEKASMAFELSLAVRNKAVQAYQQVMSMQF
jgi:flagellar hook-basal body complex protein FliE